MALRKIINISRPVKYKFYLKQLQSTITTITKKKMFGSWTEQQPERLSGHHGGLVTF